MHEPTMMQIILDWLQIIISSGTIITLIVALGRFIRQPEITQNDRITALEAEQKDIKRRLDKGDENFNNISESSAITQEALLALLGHAITGNNEAELKDAQKSLNKYLTKTSNDH